MLSPKSSCIQGEGPQCAGPEIQTARLLLIQCVVSEQVPGRQCSASSAATLGNVTFSGLGYGHECGTNYSVELAHARSQKLI